MEKNTYKHKRFGIECIQQTVLLIGALQSGKGSKIVRSVPKLKLIK